jgi:uncharacterized protein
LTSWGIALLEYVFQVPANRLGYGQFSLMQLIVFRVELTWNYLLSYLLLCGAVVFAFLKPFTP